MKKNLFQFLSSCLFVIGFSLLFILALPGTKGIVLSIISLGIGAFAIVFPMKYGKEMESSHSPLLFDFLMIAAFIAAFFVKEVPVRIYPVFICWLLCFILNVVSWLVDKQYEGKSAKEVIRANLRLPLIVDIMIIAINVTSLISEKWNVNIVLTCLLIVFALIDLCRQFIMVKNGRIEITKLF